MPWLCCIPSRPPLSNEPRYQTDEVQESDSVEEDDTPPPPPTSCEPELLRPDVNRMEVTPMLREVCEDDPLTTTTTSTTSKICRVICKCLFFVGKILYYLICVLLSPLILLLIPYVIIRDVCCTCENPKAPPSQHELRHKAQMQLIRQRKANEAACPLNEYDLTLEEVDASDYSVDESSLESQALRVLNEHYDLAHLEESVFNAEAQRRDKEYDLALEEVVPSDYSVDESSSESQTLRVLHECINNFEALDSDDD